MKYYAYNSSHAASLYIVLVVGAVQLVYNSVVTAKFNALALSHYVLNLKHKGTHSVGATNAVGVASTIVPVAIA